MLRFNPNGVPSSLDKSPSSTHCQLYPFSHSGLCGYLSNQYAHDFSQLISIPKVVLKTLRRRTNSSTYFLFSLTMNEESLAYCEMLYCFFHPCNVIPLSLSLAIALLIMCVSASSIMRNRYGAIGHPCLIHLFTLKLLSGHPFKLTAADAFSKSSLTHLMNFVLTFI